MAALGNFVTVGDSLHRGSDGVYYSPLQDLQSALVAAGHTATFKGDHLAWPGNVPAMSNGGWKIDDDWTARLASIASHNPQTVLFSLGTNDVGVANSTIGTKVTALLNAIEAASPNLTRTFAAIPVNLSWFHAATYNLLASAMTAWVAAAPSKRYLLNLTSANILLADFSDGHTHWRASGAAKVAAVEFARIDEVVSGSAPAPAPTPTPPPAPTPTPTPTPTPPPPPPPPAAPGATVGLYLTGNGTSAGSLGGPTTLSVATEALFGWLPASRYAGTKIYRCVMVKALVAMPALRVSIPLNTPSASTQISIGWGGAINGTAAVIGNEQSPPVGVTFSQPTPEAPLDGGFFNEGDERPLWIEYDIQPTVPIISEGFVLRVIDATGVATGADTYFAFGYLAAGYFGALE